VDEAQGLEPSITAPADAPDLPGEAAAAPASEATTPEQSEATSESEAVPAAAAEAEVRELSVSPESKPLLPEGHPSWVGAPPDLSNSRHHRLFVGSFPVSSLDEVDAALDEPMLAAVNGYIDEQVLDGRGASELHLTSDFIRYNLLDRSTDYIAELSTSTGPVYQKWVVLEITPEHRKHFAEAYRQVEQKKRMVALGLGLSGLLGMTAVAHLAFNRRRRRYDETVQPIVHTLMAEPEPVASKGGARFVWLLAGCLAIPLLAGSLFFVADEAQKSRTTQTATVEVGPHPTLHGEPPLPPTPPSAPEVYIEPTGVQY
jgi:hypothetical protein